ncbi:hypothetical protein DCAR_0102052 [Daucus carota subsp. sativus]|uniref:Uncharacterized protein n=1 Tax=Daucus carota subsp. sativus TaxID=79200 RepID=A0AAF0W768_DAUCS|nr:hypothetical protein DCAR_0102052 [Daucus carota subsp. sativus]
MWYLGPDNMGQVKPKYLLVPNPSIREALCLQEIIEIERARERRMSFLTPFKRANQYLRTHRTVDRTLSLMAIVAIGSAFWISSGPDKKPDKDEAVRTRS